MRQPEELKSDQVLKWSAGRGTDVWDLFGCCVAGNLEGVKRLIERDPSLVRCHYCVDSQRCTDSTHCRGSRDLLGCNHCVACDRCTQCAYCYKSVDCMQCTYCFGCVGLFRQDFHILNRPYSRSEYFALVKKLKAELKLP